MSGLPDGLPGDYLVNYDADGTAASTAQGGQVMAWGRDPARRIVTTALTGSGTDVNHYAGEGDSPAWVGHADGGSVRVVAGPAGGVSVLATTTAAGATTAVLQIGDPHGDVVATAALAAGKDVTGADVVFGPDFDEYGVNGTTAAMPASPGYGWEGVNARSASTTPGLVLMGARLYNPATGRFLTLDPVPGGNANPYTYPADPVNGEDLTGEFRMKRCRNGRWNCARYVFSKSEVQLAVDLGVPAAFGAVGAAALACGPAALLCGAALGVVGWVVGKNLDSVINSALIVNVALRRGRLNQYWTETHWRWEGRPPGRKTRPGGGGGSSW